MDERELIDEVLRGERRSYAELVRLHQARVLRLCSSLLHNEADAEDAAQEIFFKAYQSLPSFRKKSAFSTWLYRIAANHCRDLLRKNSIRRVESLDALLEESGDAVERLFAAGPDPRARMEAADLTDKILSRLSPDERLIVTLREAQGLSYREIGETLGCSLDAVKARLRRVRETLDEYLRHFSAAGRV